MIIISTVYLRKQGEKDYQKLIARFRCGREDLSNKLWRGQENLCRYVGVKLKTSCNEYCIVEIRSNTK